MTVSLVGAAAGAGACYLYGDTLLDKLFGVMQGMVAHAGNRLCGSAMLWALTKALNHIEGSQGVDNDTKGAYQVLFAELKKRIEEGKYQDALNHLDERMKEMPSFAAWGIAFSFSDLDDAPPPFDHFDAADAAMAHIDPAVQIARDPIETKRKAKEELKETLCFYSTYHILCPQSDKEGFSSIMDQVDAADPAKRQERFLEVVDEQIGDALAYGAAKKTVLRLFTPLCFSLVSFYIRHFLDNSFEKIEEKLETLAKEAEEGWSGGVNATLLSGASQAFRYVTAAINDWKKDPRSGAQTIHVETFLREKVLRERHQCTRQELYETVSTQIIDTAIPELTFFRDHLTKAKEQIIAFVSTDQFYTLSESANRAINWAEGAGVVVLALLTSPILLGLIAAAYILDKGIHYTLFTANTIFYRAPIQRVAKGGTFLATLVKKGCSNMGGGSPSSYRTKEIVLEKMRQIERNLSSKGNGRERVILPSKTRELLQNLVRDMREMVVTTEGGGGDSLLAKLQQTVEDYAADATLDQITDVIATTLTAVCSENYLDFRFAELLVSTKEALLGRRVARTVTQRELQEIDKEIEGLRKRIVKQAIHRATNEIAPGNEALKEAGASILSLPDTLLDKPKWLALLNETPHTSAERFARAEKLHTSIADFWHSWLAQGMKGIRDNHFFNEQIKAQLYRKLAPFNHLFVAGYDKEMLNAHLEDIEGAMQHDRPLRSIRDIASLACQLYRKEQRRYCLDELNSHAGHIAQTMKAISDLVHKPKPDPGDIATLIDYMETQLAAIKALSMQENEPLIARIGAIVKDLKVRLEPIADTTKRAHAIDALKEENVIATLIEARRDELAETTPFSRLWKRSQVKPLLQQLKQAHPAPLLQPFFDRARLVISVPEAQLGSLETELENRIETLEQELLSAKVPTLSVIGHASETIERLFSARETEWFEVGDELTLREKWHQEMRELDEEVEEHLADLGSLIEEIDDLLPKDKTLKLHDVLAKQEGSRVDKERLIMRFVKQMIETRVLAFAKTSDEVTARSEVLQALFDSAVALPLAQANGRYHYRT